MRFNLKHKIKKALLDLKRFTSKVPTASIVFILALVFTMAYSSYVIFASDSDVININGKDYTRYFETDSSSNSHGYVYYGSFPRSLADGTPGLPSWNSSNDGQIHTMDNERYLYEVGRDSQGHWYKFEPIKWRIINIDESTNNVLLFADEVLEGRIFDSRTINDKTLYWDGFDKATETYHGTYPAIKLYLNSYDTNKTYSLDSANTAQSVSTLTYTTGAQQSVPSNFTKFYDKGFLEKAFNDNEREAIVPDVNARTYAYPKTNTGNYGSGDGFNFDNPDGSSWEHDKVRLLSYFEMYETNNPGNSTVEFNYGFTQDLLTTDPNRIGYSNDYSASNYDFDSTGTLEWWNMTGMGGNAYCLNTDGKYVYRKINFKLGVRPVITVSLNSIINAGGVGTSASPYELKGKEPDPNALINKVKPYFEDDNKGFINYGSFPQSLATEAEASELNTNYASPVDGQVYEITEGANKGRYLYEKDYFGSKLGHWYKFEPIKWQILSVDKTNNSITVMTESCIDSRAVDTQMKQTKLLWDGTSDGTNFTSTKDGKHAYPSLRLYLNSYDTTVPKYDYFTTSANEAYSYSSLTYTEKDESTTPFAEIGFMQKAFTDSERESIIPSTSKYADVSTDGNKENYKDSSGNYDKIRLLGYYELLDSSSPDNSNCGSSYGFGSNASIKTNRIGFATDYSLARNVKIQNGNITQNSKDNTYSGYDASSERYGRYSIPWQTKSISGAYGSGYFVYQDGSITTFNFDCHRGIRPVMKLSLNDLQLDGGEGSWDEPYGFKEKPIDPEVTIDDFGTYFENPSHGYVYFGSFPKNLATTGEQTELNSTIVSPAEGKTYEITEGANKGKYLLQNSKWFKFEPIKWQILKVDDSNNKIILLSESCLESRTWDTKTPPAFWVGGTNGSGENVAKLNYPSLRLYLNSYDSTQNKYTYSSNIESYSYLKYTEHPDREFYEQGFLEKAFSDVERDVILREDNIYLNKNWDLNYEISDKVRLLTWDEMYSGNGTSFGFASESNANGISSNRIGFTTDYSKEKLSSGAISSSYDGYNGRDSQAWYLRSYNSTNKMPFAISTIGSLDYNASYEYRGIRPVISLDISRLTKSSGKGSLDNPYALVAEPEEPISKIDDKTFTKWFETGDDHKNHGFVYFGRYANSIITSAEVAVLNLPQSPTDGMVYTSTVDGNEYLYESSKWVKIEPIKWQIINIKKDANGKDELVLLSESGLQGCYYDNQQTTAILWDGTGGSEGTDANAGKHSYPALRLYLNSYDCSQADYTMISTSGLRTQVFSSLTYTDRYLTDNTVKYKDRGFLAKAFSDNERAAIVPDIPTYYNLEQDGNVQNYKDSSGKYDKVRLLTYQEMVGSHASDYGFNTETDTILPMNPYMTISHNSSYNPVNDLSNVRRKSVNYWLSSYSSGTYFYYVSGYGGINSTGQAYFGIRPVITLSVPSVSIESGNGSVYNPYMLSAGPSEIYTEELTNDGEIKYYLDGYMDEEGVLHNAPGDVTVLTDTYFEGVNVYSYSNKMALLEGESTNGAFSAWEDYYDLDNKRAAITNNGLKLKNAGELFDETLKTVKTLEKVDLTNFDSSNLTDTFDMFKGCANLESITFPSDFNTSKVNDFEYMFNGCESLEELDLSTFEIKKDADTTAMFGGCASLEMIQLPKSVDTGSEPELPGSYWAVYKEDGTKLADVSHLPGKNTYALGSYVKSTAPKVIYQDPDDESIKYNDTDALYAWDISKTGDSGVMAYYFETGITNSDGEKEGELVFYSLFDEETASYEEAVAFYGSFCGYEFGEFVGDSNDRLKTEDSDVDDPLYYKTVLNKSRGFENINGDTYQPWQLLETYDEEHTITKVIFANELKLPSWSEAYFALLPNVTEFKGMENLNLSNVYYFNHMFWGLTELEELDLSHFSVEGEAQLAGMFEGCVKLDDLDFSSFDKAEPDSFYAMFANCTSLSSLNLSMIDTSSVETMWGMFKNCINLENLNISNWDTSSCYEFDGMFLNCNSLKELDLSHFDFETEGYDFCGVFASTPTLLDFVNIAYMDIEDLDDLSETSKKIYSNEFSLIEPKKNSSLKSINLGETKISGEIRYLFYGLDSLEEIDLSNLSFDNCSSKYDYEHMLDKCSSLKKIILPSEIPDEGNVTLPEPPEDSTWRGNDNSGPYVNLPKKEGNLEYIYLKSSIIEVGEGTNKKQYRPSEATYAWDISKAGEEGSVFAYYFEDNDKYDGELIFYSNDESKTAMKFTDYLWKNYSGKLVVQDYPNEYSNSIYKDKTISDRLTDGDFAVGSKAVTPWSLLLDATSGDNPIKEVIIANKLNLSSGEKFFANLNGVTKITGIENINTDSLDDTDTDNMEKMFAYCKSLEGTLDLTHMNFAKVKSMDSMFASCNELEYIHFADDIDTSNVTTMSALCVNSGSLKKIDISNFNTSAVTKMDMMFMGCEGLTELDVSKFNTSNVTTMSSMFDGCGSLTELDVSSFNTGNVTSMNSMFNYCWSLTEIDVSNFVTTKVTDMLYMFYYCEKLTELNLSNFNTNKVTTMDNMFCYCKKLKKLNISNFKIDSSDLNDDFALEHGLIDNCNKLEEIILPASLEPTDIALPVSTEAVWKGNNQSGPYENLVPKNGTLTSIKLVSSIIEVGEGTNKKQFNINDATYAWDISENLGDGIIVYYFAPNTEKGYDGELIFTSTNKDAKSMTFDSYVYENWDGDYEFSYLPALDSTILETNYQNYLVNNEFRKVFGNTSVKPWDILIRFRNDSNKIKHVYVADAFVLGEPDEDAYNGFFSNLIDVVDMNLDKLDVSQNKNMNYMFSDCSSLTSLDLSSWNPKSVETFEWVFSGCSNLTSIDFGEEFDLTSATSFSAAFRNIPLIETIDISAFKTSDKLLDLEVMFADNTKLTNVVIGEQFNIENVNCISSMFENCTSLTEIDLTWISDTSKITDYSWLFDNCPNLESVDISTFDFMNKDANVGHFFDECNKLTKVILPKSVDGDVKITLPQVEGYKWTGYKGNNKVGGTYSVLPASSETIDNIRIVENIIVINEGTADEKSFKTSEATYKWDISDWGDKSVMAYYFNDTSKGYDGELIFDSVSPDNEAMVFDYYGYYSTFYEKYKFNDDVNDLITEDNYTTYLSDNKFRELPDSKSIAPWQILLRFRNDNNKIKHVYVANKFKLVNLNGYNGFFEYLIDAEDMDVSKLDVSEATNLSRFFNTCSSLTSLDLSSWDTSSVTDFDQVFSSCTSLTSIDFGEDFDLTSVKGFDYTFGECTSLTSLDLSALRTSSSLLSLQEMFSECTNLQSVEFGDGFVTTNVEDISEMFNECSGLLSVDLSFIDTSHIWKYFDCFNGCSSLTSVDLSSFEIAGERTWPTVIFTWDDSTDISVSEFFEGCTSLQSVKLPSSIAAGIEITLPQDSESSWTGYKEGNKVGGVYSKLVQSNSSAVDELRRIQTAIKVNEGTADEKIYNTADALYEWDISENGDGGVLAYYFNGTGAVSGNTYDGEVVIFAAIPGSKMMRFNSRFSDESGKSYNHDFYGTDKYDKSLYPHTKNDLFNAISESRGFANWDLQRPEGVKDTFAPWTLLQCIDDSDETISKPVKYIYFANDVIVGDTLVMFADLPKLEKIDLSHLISTTSGDNQTTNMSFMFEEDANLTSIVFPQTFNTSKVTDISFAFYHCYKLEDIDIRYFDSTNIKDAHYMFECCKLLTTINMGNNFTLSNCENFSNIFESCESLEELDISKWNTSSAEDLSYMFCNCKELKTLKTGENFKAVKRTIEWVEKLFAGCEKLEKVDLSGFDISLCNTEYEYSDIFKDMSSLKEIILPVAVSTSKEIPLPEIDGKMWRGYKENSKTNETYKVLPAKTESVDTIKLVDYTILAGDKEFKPSDALYTWDISKEGDGSILVYYFDGDKKKDGVTDTLREYDGELVIYSNSPTAEARVFTQWLSYTSKPDQFEPHLADAVWDCNATPWSVLQYFTNYDVNEFYIASSFKITSGHSFFGGLDKVTSLDASKIDMTENTSCEKMFDGCDNLQTVVLNNTTTDKLTNMFCMFNGDANLEKITFGSNFNTSNVTNMNCLFNGCESLTDVDIENIDTSSVTNISYMFSYTPFTELDLSHFNLQNIQKTSGMFEDCHNLQSITWPSTPVQMNNLTYMFEMFQNCYSLKEIDLSYFSLSKPTDFERLFQNCYSLEEVDLTNIDTSLVTNVSYMFLNCVSLEEIDLTDNDFSSVIYSNSFFAAVNNIEEFAKWNDKLDWYLNATNEEKETYEEDYDWCRAPHESNLEHIYFNESQTFNPNSYNDTFFGLHNLKELDLSSFVFTSDKTFNDNALYHLNSLKKIILPTKASGEGVNITLPEYPDSKWVGYKNGSKVGGVYTTLPFNENGNGEIDEVRLISSIITVGEGANKKEYRPSDAKYIWDISDDDHLGSIMAYYFDGTTNKDGNPISNPSKPFDGELVIVNSDDNAKMIEFTSTIYKNALDGEVYLEGNGNVYNHPQAESIESERGYYYNDKYYTPWSILEAYNKDGHKIKSISFANDVKAPSGWLLFAHLPNLEEVKGIEKLSFDDNASLCLMFANDKSLREIDLSDLDISKVQTVRDIFAECESLKSVKLPATVNENLEDVYNMFGDCYNLESVNSETLGVCDLSDFDMHNVECFTAMFMNCWKIKKIDFGNNSFENAIYMNKMFVGCHELTDVKFATTIDTSKLEEISYMFVDCPKLTKIDLSMFDASSLKEANYVFSPMCFEVFLPIYAPFSPWPIVEAMMEDDPSYASTIQGLRDSYEDFLLVLNTTCESNLTEVKFGPKFVNNPSTDPDWPDEFFGMFFGCDKLTKLDLSTFNFTDNTFTNDIIKGCTGLTEIKVPNSMTNAQDIPLVSGDHSYWIGCNDSNTSCGKKTKLEPKSSTLTKVVLVTDTTSPVVTKVASDKSTFGQNKDITLTLSISEVLDTENFASINKDNFYIKIKFGNNESVVKYDNYGLDPATGDFILIFKGKTPTISEEGEFKLTGMTLVNNGEEIVDLASNELDTSSLKESVWKNALSNVSVNTTGFPISITAKDYQEAQIVSGGTTNGDLVVLTVDFSDITLVSPSNLDDVLSKFELKITNGISSKTSKNKTLNLKEVKDGSYPFASFEELGTNKYKVAVNLSDDGTGSCFIEKDDTSGYLVSLEVEKGVLENADTKNIKSTFDAKVIKHMEEGSLTVKLVREGEDDKELVFNKQRQRFEDGNGNEVKFQDGDKIKITSPEGSKIVYKQDGSDFETPSNELVIDIDKNNPPKPYEEIGSYKDGYSINPNDLVKITINFVKLIIIKEGPGGTVTPLGEFEIDSDEKEIQITVDADYKASIYEGSTFIKSLTAAEDYLIKNLKKLVTDLTVKVKFVSTKAPEPAPSGGGGGGGGGVTYTILPDTNEVLHKSYIKGYEDKTFRPNSPVTREEVATIVARLDTEFNEDYNFTNYNTFPDVDKRWSKNYIGFCKMKDLIHGYEDGSFGPTRYMTRAELAVLVSNFLRVQNADFSKVDLTKSAFSDVDGRWYEEAVNKLASLGILNGYEDGTFRGDNPVTRIEVTIVMNKINHRTVFDEIPEEYITKVTSMFKDVTPNRWFFNDVAEAAVDHPDYLY